MKRLKNLGIIVKKDFLKEFKSAFIATVKEQNPPVLFHLKKLPENDFASLMNKVIDAFLASIIEDNENYDLKEKLEFFLSVDVKSYKYSKKDSSDFIAFLHAEKSALISILPLISQDIKKILAHIKSIESYFIIIHKKTIDIFQSYAIEEVKKANILLNEAQQIGKIGNWKHDFIKGKTTWSDTLFELHGIDKNFKLSVENMYHLVHPEDRSFIENEINDSRINKEHFDFQYRLVIDGQIKFAHTRGKFIFKDNQPRKLIGITQDVTDKMELVISLRKNEEELIKLNERLNKKVKERTKELEAYAEKFKFLLETMPQLAWTADAEGRITYMNSQWLHYTGRNSLEGFKTKDYLHPEDWKAMNMCREKAKKTNEQFEIKYRWKRADNKYRWFLGKIVPVKNEDGQLYMWIGTATEIHNQEISSQRKDEFISIASHELKTPLTNIKAYVQLLEQRIEDTTLKSFAEKAGIHVDKLSVLIADLLDLSKIQSGQLTIELTELSIETIVNECIETFNLTNPGFSIIKKGDFSYKIKADKRRIEQVLVNFISNSIKYARSNKDIIIESYMERDHGNIAITDQGIGIPSGQLDKIFKRFYRVETKGKFIKGMGLGLFISKEIINLHKGNIWVKSTVDIGSTFCFTVPLAQSIENNKSQELYFAQ
ncbi:MAG: PAS domain-containing protein [Bacteroidetes bacterium]|nr:PAS domain-containing protein [Bacteroidota bacterium]